MIRNFLKQNAALLAVLGVIVAVLVAPAAYDFLSDAGLAPRGFDVHYRQVALRGGIVEDFTIRGTTPTVTIGDAGAEDTGLVFDGNAQDFYVSLDDSADDLVIGLGSVVGTTPILAFDENQASTFSGDALITGTTPLLTVGDGGAEDAGVLFDGNGAQDFYIGFDDTTDDLYIGFGAVIGANAGITIQEDGTTTVSGLVVSASPVVNAGDNTDADIGFNWDHLTNDWYFEVDADDDLLYMGLGTVAATTPAFQVNASQVMTFYQDPIFGGATPRVTIGDAAAEDTSLVYDGIAQDYYIGLEDATDTLKLGLGSVLGTTEAMTVDANLDITFHDATASDMTLIFDGNVQDFYICEDDSADDLVFGFGSVCGTTPALAITEAADLLVGESQLITIFQNPAADASGDLVDLTVTFNANATAGTETLLGFDLNLTAGTVAAGDVIRGIDLALTNADGDSTDTGILISGAWDVALDVQSLRIDLDSDSDSSLRASADDTVVLELLGTDIWTFTVPGADASGDYLDFTATLAANGAAGTETLLGLDFNLTAGAVAAGDAIRGIDLALTNADGDSTDTGLLISGAWDVAIDVQALRIDLDTNGGTSIRGANGDPDNIILELSGTDLWTLAGVPSAAGSVDLLDLSATFPIQDGTDTLRGFDVNLTGANHTGTGNELVGMNLALTTPDAQARERAIVIGSNWDLAVDTAAPIVSSAMYWFDDFIGDAVLTPYTERSGSDAQAVQAIVEEQYGVYQLTSGDASTGTAADFEGISLSLEWTADQGSLIFETRLHLDDSVLTTTVCAGLTDDVTTIENFADIAAGDVITTNATDGVAFCYDTSADTDQWFALGVDTNVDATGNAATTVAPVADTYQVLRIEVSSDGVEARFYIDGTLRVTTTLNTVTPTVVLAPFISVDSAETLASHVVDIDYILVAAQRA